MFSAFTKIKQFSNIVKAIHEETTFIGLDENEQPMFDFSIPMPIIKFTGTVKLHGTNASVVKSPNNELYFQSRKNKITPMNDNQGFAFFANSKEEIFKEFFNRIVNKHKQKYDVDISNHYISIYGEWCGGNIQKNVAINNLPKMFVIFAIKIFNNEEDSCYLTHEFYEDLNSEENNIYSIRKFKTYEMEIDFNEPKKYVNKLVELTNEVENNCPVGAYFGRGTNKDDNVTGEGIVWEGIHNNNKYRFKTKGEKHSSTKVKKIVSVDIEKLNSINEFVDYSLTENRLNQAIEQIFTISNKVPEKKHTGEFLRWIINDIIDEEKDVLIKSDLIPKDVNASISKKASTWFFKYLEDMIFNIK